MTSVSHNHLLFRWHHFRFRYSRFFNFNCGTVPVELIRFDGEAIAAGNQLTWHIGSETNNDRFILKSSTDGQIFTPIANIDGRGTTALQKQYQYLSLASDSDYLKNLPY